MSHFSSNPYHGAPKGGRQTPPTAGFFFGASPAGAPFIESDPVIDELAKLLFGGMPKGAPTKGGRLPVRITQGDALLTIEYLLPGLKRDAISIQVEPAHLTVTVKEPQEPQEQEEKQEEAPEPPQVQVLRDDLSAYSRPGLSSKVHFEKFLKHRVNPQDVKATLADGVLTITVPTDSQPADAVDVEIA